MAKIDKYGLWFSTLEKMGEPINYPFGILKADAKEPTWIYQSHAKFDAIGGLTHLLHQNNYVNFSVPQLRSSDRPNWLTKLMATFSMLNKVTSAPLVKSNNRINYFFSAESIPIAWKMLTEGETKNILIKAKKIGISLNTLLLYTLTQAVLPVFASATEEVAWRIPVNLRGGIKSISETANSISFIDIKYNKKIFPLELHQTIKQSFLKNEHWGNWNLSNFFANFGNDFRKHIIEKSINQGLALTGIFSNMGEWSIEKMHPDEVWMACPPVFNYHPIGASSIIWSKKLILTIRIHPSLSKHSEDAWKILNKWCDGLFANNNTDNNNVF